jgi:hypothetical protein
MTLLEFLGLWVVLSVPASFIIWRALAVGGQSDKRF